MTIKDEILDKLWKQTPIAAIRAEYRSVGRQYEAIRQYLPEAEKIVRQMQTKLGKLKTDLAETKAELERVNSEKEKASVEVQELVQAKVKLKEEITQKTEELHACIVTMSVRTRVMIMLDVVLLSISQSSRTCITCRDISSK